MPQRIGDHELRGLHHTPENTQLLVLDLRDARKALTIAVEALELVADQNDAAYPKQIARTALDRIKGIG